MNEPGTIFFEPLSGDDLPDIPALQDAQKYLIKWYNEHTDARHVFFNYNRVEQVLKNALFLSKEERISPDDLKILLLASAFSEVDRANPEESAKAVWDLFANEWEYNSQDYAPVGEILGQLKNEENQSLLVNLIRDAQMGSTYSAEFEHTHPLRRLELELLNQKEFSNLEWNELLYQDLLKAGYKTPAGRRTFGALLSRHLLEKKNKAQRLLQKQKSSTGILAGEAFEGIEKKIPNSAIQTFFRTNYRNHINLSSIADTKANIMISVNAILISVVISILSYRNIPEAKPIVLLPVVIFLVTGLTSLIFAVLSIRPKVTALNTEEKDMSEIRKNILFFGNFVNLSLGQFEEAMDTVLRDGQLLYGNMVRDIYHLGKVLDKKYRYLTLSYNIFMVGFVATVLTFLIVIFS
ncbi:MAG: hypothetical protein HKN16_12415 [Saprospiraceae bacterium]|nr:hypothetical protein [Saprospiraceae bacterium]